MTIKTKYNPRHSKLEHLLFLNEGNTIELLKDVAHEALKSLEPQYEAEKKKPRDERDVMIARRHDMARYIITS